MWLMRNAFLLHAALLGTAFARADQYWVAWEGTDYPENEGWTRIHYGEDGPPANRALSDGIMTIDGLASTAIIDSYRLIRPLDPGPGEEFVVQWRVRVDAVAGNPLYLYDPGMAVYSDATRGFALHMGEHEVRSALENAFADFDPGVFHDWELRSTDMQNYDLRLDGHTILTGQFQLIGFGGSEIYWGDFVWGAASRSDWDYFRFGVVPEPGSCILLLTFVWAARRAFIQGEGCAKDTNSTIAGIGRGDPGRGDHPGMER